MRSEEETNAAIERYGDTVRRLCMIQLKNEADTQDIFQTVFLKYLLHDKPFESRAHEKAWFIRVTLNACKDLLRSFFRSRTVPLEELTGQADQLTDQGREVLRAVLELPRKEREVVYLHYYEGYTAPELSRLLGKNVNTIYTNLARARAHLKEVLGGEDHG
ncbi:RNA polymerase sigma factor [Flavonifractor sp. An112]|uniref:RNA polymerase sigma factor n=1 Tax=Flavonifractor sp. An112 TaxID=1965544 RepID=UPI00174E7AD5|nr:sigma-70 family RNA polymerase sigma factor [Flavonifractor sp. An112]HIZ93507.1 sigma-70 family RNA polymerase sigma factor [Candidatus Flavonifractor avicola]